jgi:hypothetical protein
MEPSSARVHCESRVTVAEARGEFGKPDEGKCPPLEAVSRELVYIHIFTAVVR